MAKKSFAATSGPRTRSVGPSRQGARLGLDGIETRDSGWGFGYLCGRGAPAFIHNHLEIPPSFSISCAGR